MRGVEAGRRQTSFSREQARFFTREKKARLFLVRPCEPTGEIIPEKNHGCLCDREDREKRSFFDTLLRPIFSLSHVSLLYIYIYIIVIPDRARFEMSPSVYDALNLSNTIANTRLIIVILGKLSARDKRLNGINAT